MASSCRLRTLTEYKVDDKNLSFELLESISQLLKAEGLEECIIEVKDGHLGETEPHYQLRGKFNNCTEDQQQISFKIDYSSIDDDNKDNGFIEINLSLPESFIGDIANLFINIFGYYDDMMAKYYSTCEIKYEPWSIQLR